MTAYNVVNRSGLQGGQAEDISVVLANFDALATVINGNLDNTNLLANAAIAITKLAGGSNDDFLEMVAGVPTWKRCANARGSKVAATNLLNNTFTPIPWATEDWDNDTMLDVAGGTPSRIFCKTAGKYLAVGVGNFLNNAVGARYLSLRKTASGGAPVTNWGVQEVMNTGAADFVVLNPVDIINLAVNDYVELVAWQDSGGALDVTLTSLSLLRLV